ncbi:flagellar basal body-associated FliL family protein [Aromatoleum sp.]|uniref:flagellar basal body-associated FliL family protein n=1 Tax=Aromatoleum sp. TaxID=2307007 RepID=UPI002FC9F0D0
MAKAPATPKPEAPEAAPVTPRRSKKLLIVVVSLVVVVMLLLVGVAGLLMLKKGKSADAEHAEEVETSEPFDLSKPPTFVALEPFVVNLAPEDGERYLQVVLALRVGDPKTGEMLGGFMPAIRHQINLLLAGKLPSELATPAGRETLADEIVERTNGVLGGSRAKGADPKAPAGPIQAVLFNSFIIQ